MRRKFLQNHARVRCLKSGAASQFHLVQAVSLLSVQHCGRDLWHSGAPLRHGSVCPWCRAARLPAALQMANTWHPYSYRESWFKQNVTF